MILAGNQPYFLPYLAYWQLIHSADVFKISDDYQYIKKGWINRNRILVCGSPCYFRLDMARPSTGQKINELYINEIPVGDKLKQIRLAYGRAPCFDSGVELLNRIFSYKNRNLAAFLAHSIETVCEYLGIKTKLVLSSDFAHNSDYRREHRLYDLCQRIGADTYHNAIGGQKLYSYEEFEKRGIKLAFLKMGDIRYPQFGQEFVPNLSILDVIMFNPVEKIREMLDCYTLLDKSSENTLLPKGEMITHG